MSGLTPAIWDTQLEHGYRELAAGRLEQSEAAFKQAVHEATERGREHPDLVSCLIGLAGVYRTQGKLALAEPLYRQALAILGRTDGGEHPDLAACLNSLAVLYVHQGRQEEAENLYVWALSVLERVRGLEHPEVALALNNLASLYDQQGRYREAEVTYRRLISLAEAHPVDGLLAVALCGLAGLLRGQNRLEEAVPLYRRALNLRESDPSTRRTDLVRTLRNLASLLGRLDCHEEAAALETRAGVLAMDARSP